MSMRMKNGQKPDTNPSPRIARPPIRWLKERNFSAAKFRSANWLLKNNPRTAERLNAPRINHCSQGPNPRLGRYPNTSGNHAPQIKNSRNIMTERRKRSAEPIDELQANDS